MVYQIRIKGHLDEKWSDWFGDVTIMHENNGVTLFTCQVVDQAALHGLLKRIRDLGIPLISMNRLREEEIMSEEVLPQTKATTISASFQQKSIGVSLFIIASTAIYYLARAWSLTPSSEAGTIIPDGYNGLVVTTLVLIILLQIILQIVLVIGAGSEAKPTNHEKDASLKATRNAYPVFIIGALTVIALLILNFPIFYAVNLTVMSLLLAEITRLASHLFYSRKSTR